MQARLRELIAQIWFGDDFRLQRPTPVDEAKWGFAVIEQSLWKAVPRVMRDIEAEKTGVFFAPVGTIGRAFLEIESQAFSMDGTG